MVEQDTGERVGKAGRKGGQIAAVSDRAQGGQDIGARVGKIGKVGGQTSVDSNQVGQIAKESGRAQRGQLVDGRVGKAEKKGGQVTSVRVGKTPKRGGQASDEGMSVNGAWGAQIAQLIPLSSTHPNFPAWVGKAATPKNPAPDDAIPGRQPADGQATSWIKSLLPESQSGWWEVGVRGKGFSVRFRWRDAVRQTLLFPRITVEEFTSLKQSDFEEAARILRERISANLRSFLLDPARRGKALAVAAKLGIDLSVPAVHSLVSKEI